MFYIHLKIQFLRPVNFTGCWESKYNSLSVVSNCDKHPYQWEVLGFRFVFLL